MRGIRGRPDFVYVADSKLCSRENMDFIAGEGGTFVTVLPRTRKEHAQFRELIQKTSLPWEEVRREENPRGKDRPEVVYLAFEPKSRTEDGYRITWYRSSIKTELDQKRRSRKIYRARAGIRELEQRTGAHRLRSKNGAEEAVNKVLQDEGAQRWLKFEIVEHAANSFKQTGPGRPGRGTTYRRVQTPIIKIQVEDNAETIKADACCDGLFAMVTNIEDKSPLELLDIYKYQPFLEKRNEQLKTVLSVAPVFLKNPRRVAALLFVYFLALLLFALIERELRAQMKKERIKSLPLYPEQRPCKAPTSDVIMQAVDGMRRSQLLDTKGKLLKVFHDPMPPHVKKMLRLLGVDLRAYGAARRQ